ncbi:YodC family protein [Mesorhizobium sp. 128a]
MNAHSYGGDSPWFNGVPLPETEDTFAVGDLVTLLSGGPALTVIHVCDCGTVEVAWFDGASLSVQDLPEEALVYWADDDD